MLKVGQMATTLKQHAYEYIRHGLTSGNFSAGQRLSPAALAQDIGVSPIPVREAISQLHSEGLVVQIPQRGAFVREPDREELAELIELRGVLECNAAARAARRIGGAELDELEDRLKTLHDLVDEFAASEEKDVLAPLGRWMLADLVFHMVLLRAAGNRRIIKVIEETHIMAQMFGYRSDYPEAWANLPTFFQENYKVHNDIYAAVRRHNPKAARRAMAVHMRRARKNILARFDWLHQQPDADSPLVRDFPDSMRRLVRDIQQRNLQRCHLHPEHFNPHHHQELRQRLGTRDQHCFQ